MSEHIEETTRRSLHGVAELVLAGPQYAESGTIRLRVTPGGFGTVGAPDLRVEGTTVVAGERRVPLSGTFAGLAAAVGVEARPLRDVYADGPGVVPESEVLVDEQVVASLLDAFGLGDAAMRAFAPDQEPVLWPEHFDLGISVDEVNYGVSPGDAHSGAPYAYVGPWTQREGAFWNTPFGAACPLTDLPDVDSLVAFFREGANQAAVGA